MGGNYPWDDWTEFNFKCGDNFMGEPRECFGTAQLAVNPGPASSCTLTRVIFPDLATTVVSTNTGESIRALVSRLLDKRNLRLTSFDVFVSCSADGAASTRPLDLSEDCAMLHCAEVRVESRVLFRLELPSHKSIGIKVNTRGQ